MPKKYLGKIGSIGGLHLIEFSPEDFDIIYWDKPKLSASNYDTVFNAGFFGVYKEGATKFTLPAANLACNIEGAISPFGKKYIEEWTNKRITNNHFELSANQGSGNFKNKNVTTLIIDNDNKISMRDINIIPSNTKLAISGAPCLRNGQDVDYKKYVRLQGWGADIFRATYHNWLAIRNNKLYLISGKSFTNNMIYGMWFYKQIKDYEFEDICLLDGGGSYCLRYNNKWISYTGENRRINTIGVIKK